MLRKIKRIVLFCEDESHPIVYNLATFCCILLLRDFLESFSQASSNYLNLAPSQLSQNLIHFTLGFICVACSLILLLYAATREPISKIMRSVTLGFVVILLSPLLDLIFTQGIGQDMMYLGMSEQSPTLLTLFLTFYKDYSAVSLGIRVELVIAFIGIFMYCYAKRNCIIISLVYTLLAYIILFIFSAAPLLIKVFCDHMHIIYQFSSILMTRVYLSLLPALVLPILFFSNAKLFITVVKDMRWLRILHYWLAMCLGTAFAMLNYYKSNLTISDNYKNFIINFIFCSISLCLAALYTIIQNNIQDQPIDKISNPTRPLSAGVINITPYFYIGLIALFLAIVYAMAAGVKALFLMMILVASYYVYSTPPLRFKRIFILSKLVIGFNFLVCSLLGYSLFADSVRGFPVMLVPIFLIGFTLIANLIDIKDHQGDQLNGITTIATKLNRKQQTLFLSIAFFITYVAFYFLIDTHDTLLAILLFITLSSQIKFIAINNFNEKSILVLNCLSISIFISYLLTFNWTN